MDDHRTPPTVLQEIGESRRSLVEYGKNYSIARRELVRGKVAYEKAYAQQMIKLLADYKMNDERVPAEDLRKAIAQGSMDEGIWTNYLKAEADVDALRRCIEVESANLTSLQSELSFLRDEMRLAS